MSGLRTISTFFKRIGAGTGETFYVGAVGGVKVDLTPTDRLDENGHGEWTLVSYEPITVHTGADAEILAGGCVVYRQEDMFPALRKNRCNRPANRGGMTQLAFPLSTEMPNCPLGIHAALKKNAR